MTNFINNLELSDDFNFENFDQELNNSNWDYFAITDYNHNK